MVVLGILILFVVSSFAAFASWAGVQSKSDGLGAVALSIVIVGMAAVSVVGFACGVALLILGAKWGL